jgi:beta-glucuronidase
MNKKTLASGVILQLSCAAFALGQSVDLITNVEARKHLSLNGTWRIIVDPYEDGYFDYRYEPKPDGYFTNQKPDSKSDHIEYDFDASETLRVPGDWNSQKEKLFFMKERFGIKRISATRRSPAPGCLFTLEQPTTRQSFI